MRAILVAFCLLTATACDENTPTGPTVPLNQQFTLAAGEVAVLADTDLRVQFLRVSGDSRCPADAFCIQGGDALVHLRVFDDGTPREVELHTGDSSRATVTIRQVQLTLAQLQPYPFSGRTIEQHEYRATLEARR